MATRQSGNSMAEGRGAEGQPAAAGADASHERRTWALTGLFVIAVFGVLYVGRTIFIPIAFALMLTFVFRPLVRLLKRVGVPVALGATLVLMGLTGAMGYGVVQLSEPASDWFQRMPKAMRSIERKVIRLRRPVEGVTKLADRVERMAKVDQQRPVREVTLDKPGLLETAVGAMRQLVSGAVIMLITLYFMLVWGETLGSRLVEQLSKLRGEQQTSALMNEVQHRMSSYMRTVVLINGALGLAVGIAMHLLGMPNPILWGVFAGVVNFVPYLGSLAGVVVVALAALLTFDSTTSALLPPAVYLGLTALEGNLVTPVIMGRKFRISPLVVFVWLVLWAWLWGLAGALLAVPLLMLLKLASEHSQQPGPFAALLRR